MTFQSRLDVWEAEGLRTSNLVRALSAADVIRMVIRMMGSHGLEMPLFTAGAPAGPFDCRRAEWTRAWREMISRKIGWAAAGCAARSRLIEAWSLLHPLLRRLTAAEPLRVSAHEQEVDTSAQTCL